MNCLFCKIVAREIPAEILYEDEHALAFLDIHPVNPGHTLVIPKAHSQNILDIDASDWLAVAEATRNISIQIHGALSADGINLRMNNRETAGQDVKHPHMHVIPRYKGDGLTHWPGKSYQDGEARELAEKIRKAH